MKILANLWWRLVRFGFRLLYNEMAFTYDLVSVVVSLGEWRSWQRAALKYLPDGKNGFILELAHGTGNLQIDLFEGGYQTIGYDLSPYMGQIASRKLKRKGMRGRLVRGKAQQLPFPAQQFRAVISTFPTDFIFADVTLKEVHRILEPEGRFIIVPNGVLTGGGATEKGLEWLYRITGQRGEQNTSIREFFAKYGFEAALQEERYKRSIAEVIVARKIP